jgi:hypothetical protein
VKCSWARALVNVASRAWNRKTDQCTDVQKQYQGRHLPFPCVLTSLRHSGGRGAKCKRESRASFSQCKNVPYDSFRCASFPLNTAAFYYSIAYISDLWLNEGLLCSSLACQKSEVPFCAATQLDVIGAAIWCTKVESLLKVWSFCASVLSRSFEWSVFRNGAWCCDYRSAVHRAFQSIVRNNKWIIHSEGYIPLWFSCGVLGSASFLLVARQAVRYNRPFSLSR